MARLRLWEIWIRLALPLFFFLLKAFIYFSVRKKRVISNVLCGYAGRGGCEEGEYLLLLLQSTWNCELLVVLAAGAVKMLRHSKVSDSEQIVTVISSLPWVELQKQKLCIIYLGDFPVAVKDCGDLWPVSQARPATGATSGDVGTGSWLAIFCQFWG